MDKGTTNINEAKVTKSSGNSLLEHVSDFSSAGALGVGSVGNGQAWEAVCGGLWVGVMSSRLASS